MTDASSARSPSLAGIISDPNDVSKRIVPASQRADGSVRKERRIKPGHVPSEDVAKYRPGQGNLRAQHAQAQAQHLAPASPSPSPSPAPAPASSSTLPPSISATSSTLPESSTASLTSAMQKLAPPSQGASTAASRIISPPASPSKPSKGSSASRWAVAAPAVEEPVAVAAIPPYGSAPASTSTSSTAANASTSMNVPSSPRPNKAPQTRARAARNTKKENTSSSTTAVPQKEVSAPVSHIASNTAPRDPVIILQNVSIPSPLPPSASPPKTPDPQHAATPPIIVPTTIAVPSTDSDANGVPALPDTSGGDWWDEDSDDIDTTAAMLQGISMKDAASTPVAPINRQQIKAPNTAPQQGSKTSPSRGGNNKQGGPTGTATRSTQGNQKNDNKKAASAQQHQTPSKRSAQADTNKHSKTVGNNNHSAATDLFSRLGPAPPLPDPKTPKSKQGDDVFGARSSSSASLQDATQVLTAKAVPSALGRLSIDDIRNRARSISEDLRQINQLKRYATSGAVLSTEQRSKIESYDFLREELMELHRVSQQLAKEVTQFLELADGQ